MPSNNPFFVFARQTTSWLTATTFLFTQTAAYAAPLGGNVVGGAASIAQSGSTTTITQSTSRGIINWQSFDIGNAETVNFHQPSAQSITLNRVTGSGGPSQILGNMNANGTVMVINASGIIFGANSQINVGNLVASTSDIADTHFMAGDYRFTTPGRSDARIVNHGTITAAEGGLVALVAPNVTNNGLIQARLGRISMASGDSFTVDLYGDGLINLKASDAITQQLISNSGKLSADGGAILLTTAAAKNAVDAVINMDGVIEARAMQGKDGAITLLAENGKTHVNGKLDASGYGAGERGGTIDILGKHIHVKELARIDASGDTGGGNIRIGGDYKGQGITPTAQTTIIAKDARIKANAISHGNGGKVIIWSDDSTEFAGHIEAKAGAFSGNGGFVETSGKINLTVTGLVDTSSVHGQFGTWLLDPTNITIYNRSGSGDNTNTFTTDQLETMSIGSNVTLSASSNVTFDLTGDTLTLANNRDFTITAGATISNTSAGTVQTAGTGSISLTGNRVTLDNTFSLATGGGNITMAGITTLAGSVNAGAGDIAITHSTQNNGNGGIILNSGANLIADDVTLLINPGTGSRIDLNSGSQINATGSVLLQDATSTYINDGWNGIHLASGASITAQDLTLLTAVGNINYNGTTLTIADGISLKSTGTGHTNINTALTHDDISIQSNQLTFTNANINNFRLVSGLMTIGSGGHLDLNGGAATLTGLRGINIASGVVFDTENHNIASTGLATIAGTINAGTGDISLTHSTQNNANGGITLNSGANLIADDITLLINPGTGSRIDINSGSQINATGSVLLQDATSTYINDGWNGIHLASGATITAANFTAQTAVGNINYNGTTLDITNGILLKSTGTGIFNVASLTSDNLSMQSSNFTLANADVDKFSVNTSGTTGLLTISSGGHVITNDADFSFTGRATIAGELNAGAGDITITDNVNNNNNGGITLNSGANLIGDDITLAVTPVNGARIDITSGSQINATGSVLLNDALTSPNGGGLYNGINLNSGASITAADLTVQTVGSQIYYNGATLDIADSVLLRSTSTGSITINSALTTNNLTIESNTAPTLSANITGTTSVTLRPYSDTTTVGVAGGSGTYSLSTTALNRVITPALTIGRSTSTVAMNVASGYNWASDLTLKSGSGIITVSGATMGANDLSINTDGNLAITGNVTGTGELTIGTSAAATTMGIAGGTGTLNIDATELAYIGSGWSNLNFGNTGVNGAMNIANYNWANNVNFNTGSGAITFTGGTSTLASGKSLSATSVSGDVTESALGSIATNGNGGITLTSGNNLTFTHDFDLTANGSGNIRVNAKNNIVQSGGGDITTNGGSIILNSDTDKLSVAGGAISLGTGTILASNGGDITLGGGADPLIGAALGVSGTTTGITLDGAELQAGGGDISTRGQGYQSGNSSGVNFINASKIQTNGTGSIYMKGDSIGWTTNGLLLSGNIISTVDGNIDLVGTYISGSHGPRSGVNIAGATVQATGIGDVNIDGSGAVNNACCYANNSGVTLSSGLVSVNDGDLNVVGAAQEQAPWELEYGINQTGGLWQSTGSGAINLTGTGWRNGWGINIALASSANAISSAGGTVTLKSNNDIRMTNANIVGSAGAYDVVLNSDMNAANDGGISLTTSKITTNGGDINFGGGANALTTAASTGITFSASELQAGGGDITLRGKGATAINIAGATKIQTGGSGSINLVGDTNSGSIFFNGNASSVVSTENGDLTVSGSAINGGSGGYGIKVAGGTIETTGSGNIDFNGYSQVGAGGQGIYITGGTVRTTDTGTITFDGTVGGGGHSMTGINIAGGEVSTANTDIIMNGHATNNRHAGYYQTGGLVSAGGIGNLTVDAQEDNGNACCGGVAAFYLSGGTLSTEDGDLTIMANANVMNPWGSHWGFHQTGGLIRSTGTGDITLTGNTARNSSGFKIELAGAGTAISSGGGTVTLKSNNDITLINANIVGSDGAFNTVLQADMNNTGDGYISLATSKIITNGGNITLGGGATPASTAAPLGVSLTSSELQAGGGNISVIGTGSGNGAVGVRINASKIQTTDNGTIDITGTGGNGNGNDYGVYMLGASTISSEDGHLNVTGTGRGTGTGNHGLYLTNGTIETIGTGLITLQGTGASSATGINVTGSTVNIGNNSTNDGDIKFIADSLDFTNANINTRGDAIFETLTDSTNINVANAVASGLQLTSAALGKIASADHIIIGRSNSTGAVNVGAYNWANNVDFIAGSGSINFATGTSTLSANKSLTATSTTGDITTVTNTTINTSGTGAISMNAGNDFNGDGTRLNVGGGADLNILAKRHIIGGGNGLILTTHGGDMVLNSNSDATNGGAISLSNNAMLTSNGGNITLGGGADPLTTAANGDNSYTNGIHLSSMGINAGGGDISLRGTGYSAGGAGFSMSGNNTIQTTGTGTITIIGNGGASGGAGINQGFIVSAQDGDINITGNGIGTYGIYLGGGSYTTSGLGNLNFTGTSTNDSGFRTDGGTLTTSGAGDINITGSSTSGNGIWLRGGSFNSTSTGDIVMQGTSGSATGLNIAGAGTINIGNNTTTNGDIKFIADTIDLTMANINTLKNVIIEPYSNGTIVNVATGSGGLDITSAYLSKVAAANKIIIGRSTSTGAVNVGAYNWASNVDLIAGSGNITFAAGTSTLASGKSLTATTSSGDILTGGNGGIVVSGATGAISLTSGRDINFSNDFDLTVGGSNIDLTLKAKRNIFLDSGYPNDSSDIVTNGGKIILNADSDATDGGAIRLGTYSNLTSNGGDITLGGGANPVTTAAKGNSTADIGVYSVADISAGGGNISIRGEGYHAGTGDGHHGVALGSSIQTTGSGTITIAGRGGDANTNSNYGISSSATMSTQNGKIAITGTGGHSGNVGNGVNIGGTISTTNADIEVIGTGGTYNGHGIGTGALTMTAGGTGAITMNGTASVGNNYNFGISSVTSTYTTNSGNISLIGASDGGAAPWGIVLYDTTTATLTGDTLIQGTSANSTGIYFQGVTSHIGNNTTNNGNITFVTNSMDFGTADIKTLKDVIFKPYAAGAVINVANGINTGLAISSATLNKITAAANVVIGDTGSTGGVNIGALDLSSRTHGLIVNGSGGITLGGNITTNNKQITLNDHATLSTNVALNSGTATTTLKKIDGAHNFTAAAKNFVFNEALGSVTPLSAVSLTSTDSMTLPSITAASIYARTTGALADLTIAAGKVLAASGSNTTITLAAGRNFINHSGANALATPAGRWLVYSTAPASDTVGGLNPSFRRYSCALGGSCPAMPASGNGLLYSSTPQLTVTPNPISPDPGASFSLNGYSYSLSGYLGNDATSDIVTGSLNGSTNYVPDDPAGVYSIIRSGGSLSSALGYGFNYAAGVLTIAELPSNNVLLPSRVMRRLEKFIASDKPAVGLSASDLYDNQVLENQPLHIRSVAVEYTLMKAELGQFILPDCDNNSDQTGCH